MPGRCRHADLAGTQPPDRGVHLRRHRGIVDVERLEIDAIVGRPMRRRQTVDIARAVDPVKVQFAAILARIEPLHERGRLIGGRRRGGPGRQPDVNVDRRQTSRKLLERSKRMRFDFGTRRT